MPCWTIKKTTVDVGKMEIKTLAAGLKAAGFDVNDDMNRLLFSRSGSTWYHTYKDGVLTLQGQNVEGITAEVKRAYSAQVVRQTAERFGWKLSSKTQTQFTVQRRR